MAGQLQISDRVFQRLLRELSAARAQVVEFDGRLERADDVVGFPRLRTALDEFSDDAEASARKLVRKIDYLSRDLRDVQESIEEMEQAIADTLNDLPNALASGINALGNLFAGIRGGAR